MHSSGSKPVSVDFGIVFSNRVRKNTAPCASGCRNLIRKLNTELIGFAFSVVDPCFSGVDPCFSRVDPCFSVVKLRVPGQFLMV